MTKDTRTKEQIERANRKMEEGFFGVKVIPPTKSKPATVEDSQKDNLKK